MNTVTTPLQPRSPEEIAAELSSLTQALSTATGLDDRQPILARLVAVQAELGNAMVFEEQERKKVTDLHKLVRRWYLRIVIGEDRSGVGQIMSDTVPKRLAEQGYQIARVLRDTIRARVKKSSPVEMQLSAPISEAAPVSFSEPVSVPEPVSDPVVPTPVSIPASIHRADYQSNGYITSFDRLDESTQANLSRFFQSSIDSLEHKGISTWQQRIDSMITGWNRANPDLKLYKYVPGSNDKVSAGEKWGEAYSIHSQSDFCQRFSVVFPDWLQAKTRTKKKKEVTATKPVQPKQSPENTETPKETTPATKVVGEISVPSVQPNNEKLAELTVIYIPMLDSALREALRRYKREKNVQWNPEKLVFNISQLQLSMPTARVLQIGLRTLPEEQKGFWRVITTNLGSELLRKQVMKNPGFNYEYNKTLRRIIIQTGTLTTITITIPSEEMLQPTYNKPVEDSQDTEVHAIDSLKSQFYTHLTGYLDWYYDAHYKGSKIDKDTFTAPGDIAYKILQANEEKEEKLVSGRLGISTTWPQLTYQALQSVENLQNYFGNIKNGTGVHIIIDTTRRDPVKFVYDNPRVGGLQLEFRPY